MSAQLKESKQGEKRHLSYRLRTVVSLVPILSILLLAPMMPAMGQATTKESDPVQTAGSNEAQQKKAPSDLFVAMPRTYELTKGQDTALVEIRRQATTAEVRLVRINTQVLQNDAITLNVFPKRAFSAKKKRLTQVSEKDFTWVADVDPAGPTNSAILVVRGDNVTGTIRAKGELYSVRPLGGGVHAIIRMDESKFPPDHPPEFEQIQKKSKPPEEKKEDKGEQEPEGDIGELMDVMRVLKILVAYTPAVRTAVTDIDGFIQLAIEETNQSYINSRINLTAELAYSYEATYTESGSFGTDLQRFRGTSDGVMDEVHSWRDHYGADVAVLLINNAGSCGLASDILADANTAFAVAHYGCATGYYTFAHEIGHLQGARHNPEADPSTTPFPYGHGYYYEPGKWRTVMSYNCPSGCTRLPYWSNPNVQYSSVSMGTAATHNNARVLNETAPAITNFRSVPLLGGHGYVWANNATAASYTPSATYAYNSAGGQINITRAAAGRYTVRFVGLGGNGTAGGHVQVTAYGAGNETAKVESWNSSGNDFVVNVRCFNAAGSAVDTRYTVLVTWP